MIAATNRDLKQLVSEAKFQEDLYYRLNVIPIVLPPLREHVDDIRVLIDHFVDKHQQRTGKRIERIEDEVIEALQHYGWPGNVRELENTIERAVARHRAVDHRGDGIACGATSSPHMGCLLLGCTRTSSGWSAKRSAGHSNSRGASRKMRLRRWASASAPSATTWPNTASNSSSNLLGASARLRP